ncbi:hypothetical protein SAMN05519103_00559 [Rhizobiales bacterium GAS113]|nr:hypothetical protein SAMN05519103_00559 [Rhizobiales bacterium GAS113]
MPRLLDVADAVNIAFTIVGLNFLLVTAAAALFGVRASSGGNIGIATILAGAC